MRKVLWPVWIVVALLPVSGCQVFMDLTLASFGVDRRDQELSDSERRARNEASRERVKGARLHADGYVRKQD